MEKKVREFLSERTGNGYGARNHCEMKMERLTDMFSEDALSRYGLKRNAAVFDDLFAGGQEAKKGYRAMVEKELPVNSKLPYIAEQAAASVEEAMQELESFIMRFREEGKTAPNCRLTLQPEYLRFDEEQGKVVWTQAGLEAIEEVEGYYMTNEKQLQVYELAKDIVKKVEALETVLQGSNCSAISDSMGRCILMLGNGKLKINPENIVAIKP